MPGNDIFFFFFLAFTYIFLTKTGPLDAPQGGCPGPSLRPHPLCTPLAQTESDREQLYIGPYAQAGDHILNTIIYGTKTRPRWKKCGNGVSPRSRPTTGLPITKPGT